MVTQKNFRYGKTGAGVVSSKSCNVNTELSEKYQCSKSHLQTNYGIMTWKEFYGRLVAVNDPFIYPMIKNI